MNITTSLFLKIPFDNRLEEMLAKAGFTSHQLPDTTHLNVTHEEERQDELILICRPYLRTIEQRWAKIKEARNELLRQCDWTQVPDVPLTTEEKLAWQTYRQALRDIPQIFETPEEVVFPEVP
jgi:hypothetical protein